MRNALLILPVLLLPACLSAPKTTEEYEDLVKEFKAATADYKPGDGMVLPLLPDVLPSQEKFMAAAKQNAGSEDAMLYLGWLLQNSPRNPKAHAYAVEQIDALAEKQAAELLERKANLQDLAKISRSAVQHLKYNKVEDSVFAKTLLDVKALAEAAGDGPIAEAARNSAFKLERLQVGMVAPDIEAKDLDGVDFKLSDYRGKVVVIDFWGDW